MTDSVIARAGRKRRPRIADIAEHASVSVSTVDRVLNGRLPVRNGTAERVLHAAETLGYHATGLIRRRIAEAAAPVRVGFLLQKATKPSYQDFAQQIAVVIAGHRRLHKASRIAFVSDIAPQAVLAELDVLERTCDAAAIVAVDHPLINDRIARLREGGFPVVTLLSDLSTALRAGYAGIDNRKAGRTAAWTISRLVKSPGTVAIMVGSHRYLGQEDRETGFRSFFRELAPEFEILEPRLYLDDAAIAYETASELIDRYPGLAGLYSAGGGISGTLQAIRESGRGSDLVCVCHGLTPPTREGLMDGVVDMVMNAPKRLIAERAADILIAALDDPRPAPTIATIPFEIFVPENI